MIPRSLLLLAGAIVAQSATAQRQPFLALTGATLIDGTDGPAVANSVVVVKGGRIECAGSRQKCRVPAAARTIELPGKFITPGLVDAHVHMDQTGWIDGRPDGLKTNTAYPYAKVIADLRADPSRWHRAFLCSGVTAAYDVGGMPWTIAAAKADRGRSDRVNMRASGPLVTMSPREIKNLPGQPTFIQLRPANEADATVEWLKSQGAEAVKLWFLVPKPEDRAEVDARVMALGAAARKAGLAFLVHSTELREAKVALRAGATYLVHSVWDRPVDDEFLQLLARNKAAYGPTLVVGANWMRSLASIYFGVPPTIDDPNHCTAPNVAAMAADPARAKVDMAPDVDAERIYRNLIGRGGDYRMGQENLRRVHAAGGTIVLATDAGNPLTVHGPSVYQELEAMEAAGIPAPELIRIATRNGAALMGDLTRYGTIKDGKQADLLILAEDPRKGIKAFRSLEYVIRAGVLRKQAELRAP